MSWLIAPETIHEIIAHLFQLLFHSLQFFLFIEDEIKYQMNISSKVYGENKSLKKNFTPMD